MEMESLIFTLVLFPVAQSVLPANSYPSNEYEHSFNRDMLLAAEAQFEHGGDSYLTSVNTLSQFATIPTIIIIITICG